MMEFTDTLLYKLRFFIAGGLIVASLLLLPFMLSVIWANPSVRAVESKSTADSATDSLEDSPNIMTSGMVKAGGEIGQTMSSAEDVITSSLASATKSIKTAAARSGKFAARSAYSGVRFMANAAGSGFMFIASTSGNVVGSIADTSVISSLIRPADNQPVPVIEPQKTALTATLNIPPINNLDQMTHQPQVGSWPIRGVITTKFGVPHWPYQPNHTGMDISDGRPSGVTRVKPFKPGQVIEATHSGVGLGNYVVVAHGGGITSVYAHLHSISVRVGQEVGNNTTLGYEGSTGASTGTHLHFEIRLNGKPINPLQFISG